VKNTSLIIKMAGSRSRYTNSQTKKTGTRTLKGEDFLALILRHVLPRGFRRVRDYGFLHANAKALLKLVPLILL